MNQSNTLNPKTLVKDLGGFVHHKYIGCVVVAVAVVAAAAAAVTPAAAATAAAAVTAAAGAADTAAAHGVAANDAAAVAAVAAIRTTVAVAAAAPSAPASLDFQAVCLPLPHDNLSLLCGPSGVKKSFPLPVESMHVTPLHVTPPFSLGLWSII